MEKEPKTRIADTLSAEIAEKGHAEGELSPAALATATAAIALSLNGKHRSKAEKATRWLEENQNDDGGWGDTPDSPSNLPTTLLADAAMELAAARGHGGKTSKAAAEWIGKTVGVPSPSPAETANAILENYGKDKTFSVPILLALAATFEKTRDDETLWEFLPILPFELATLPSALFAAIGLPVVSYALPALISMGIAAKRKKKSRNPLRLLSGALTEKKALRVLENIQPEHGGFLEAVPLTSFVAIALHSAGYANSKTAEKCLDFIADSMRPDGSAPIDSNLATWLTSLALNAIKTDSIDNANITKLRSYLLDAQLKKTHPYTGAPPGGWPWTHLPGGVPDADDTAAALLALKKIDDASDETRSAADNGVQWLLDIQNRDGGIPTFRRGWGKFEFDRSCPDITAHALAAWNAWNALLPGKTRGALDSAENAALAYLERDQASDGSWTPLWFGSQAVPSKKNTLFGTALVAFRLALYAEKSADSATRLGPTLEKAVDFILKQRSDDKGWGWSPKRIPPFETSSIEETSMAVAALAAVSQTLSKPLQVEALEAAGIVERAFEKSAPKIPAPTPFGLYFASLWYSEKLYPAVFASLMETTLEKIKSERP
jgi:squalene-hopene/tetraprenyl-beta-curcumene cyclase